MTAHTASLNGFQLHICPPNIKGFCRIELDGELACFVRQGDAGWFGFNLVRGLATGPCRTAELAAVSALAGMGWL